MVHQPRMTLGVGIGIAVCVISAAFGQPSESTVRVERLLDAPIITPRLHPSIGANIQGPSLIRVPDWVEAPLGTYYLYFADHKGSYIRLAYADALQGPWRIHPAGSLQIGDSRFLTEPPDVPPAELARMRAAGSTSSSAPGPTIWSKACIRARSRTSCWPAAKVPSR